MKKALRLSIPRVENLKAPGPAEIVDRPDF